MCRSRRAFTLIELLVVIAIIAILAAILFPVFAQAKNAAKQTQNTSNIRQLGNAALMYANDYEDTFPHQSWVGNPFYTEEYHIMFQPYIKNWGILYDPFRTHNCNQYNNKWGAADMARCMGYGVNVGVWGIGNNESGLFEKAEHLNGPPALDIMRGRPTTFFPEPAGMVLFQTTMDEPMYTTDIMWQQFDDSTGNRHRNAKPRNDGRWVRVYVDGHVRPVLMGRYRAGAYSSFVMPKNKKQAEELCWSLDALGASNRTCGYWIDYFFANRTEW